MKIQIHFYVLFIITMSYCAQQEISSLPFTSQNGQDRYVIENFFKNSDGSIMTNGFFIEFGAYDGIKFSNTKILEMLGWKGICIEPVPHVFTQLQKNRSCVCIQGCISDKAGTALFREIIGHEPLSGLSEKYDPRHSDLVENYYRGTSTYYEVPCYCLSKIMLDYNINKIDFLCIDTEGGELDILKSLSDEELEKIDVLCVEDNYGDPEFFKFLQSKNFRFITRMTQDLIFRNNKYIQ